MKKNNNEEKKIAENKIKKNYKKYISIFIVGLFMMTTFISVGYAALNQNLNIAGLLDYEKHTVWANNLSYDNLNSGVYCSTAQCMIDCLANENLCPSGPDSFSTDSWPIIVAAVKRGDIGNYNVGDTRTIDMGTLGTHTLRIANKSTPAECSTTGFSQTACGFVIEFADIITEHQMNPYKIGVTTSGNGNIGGWPASEMRTYLNSDIYNALPTELKSAIINTTVVSGYGSNDSSNFTSTDKLYLLSTHEVWQDADGYTSDGIDYYDKAYNNTRQLDYYSSQNVTTSNYSGSIKKYNSSNSYWWLRSARSDNSNRFCIVSSYGWNSYTSNNTFGVSPAFRI